MADQNPPPGASTTAPGQNHPPASSQDEDISEESEEDALEPTPRTIQHTHDQDDEVESVEGEEEDESVEGDEDDGEGRRGRRGGGEKEEEEEYGGDYYDAEEEGDTQASGEEGEGYEDEYDEEGPRREVDEYEEEGDYEERATEEGDEYEEEEYEEGEDAVMGESGGEAGRRRKVGQSRHFDPDGDEEIGDYEGYEVGEEGDYDEEEEEEEDYEEEEGEGQQRYRQRPSRPSAGGTATGDEEEYEEGYDEEGEEGAATGDESVGDRSNMYDNSSEFQHTDDEGSGSKSHTKHKEHGKQTEDNPATDLPNGERSMTANAENKTSSEGGGGGGEGAAVSRDASPTSTSSAAAKPVNEFKFRPRPEYVEAASYDIVPTMAAPQSTSVNAVTATPDMRYWFTGGSDGYIRKYDGPATINGKLPLTVAQRHAYVESVTKAGVLLSYWENEEPQISHIIDEAQYTSASSTAGVVISGEAFHAPGDEAAILSPVYSLAVHSQALWLLSGLESGGINLQSVRIDEGKKIACLRGHTNAVSVLTLAPDEKSVLSGSWDCSVRDWDLNTGRTTRTYTAGSGGGQISAIERRSLQGSPIPAEAAESLESSSTSTREAQSSLRNNNNNNGTFTSNNSQAPKQSTGDADGDDVLSFRDRPNSSSMDGVGHDDHEMSMMMSMMDGTTDNMNSGVGGSGFGDNQGSPNESLFGSDTGSLFGDDTMGDGAGSGDGMSGGGVGVGSGGGGSGDGEDELSRALEMETEAISASAVDPSTTATSTFDNAGTSSIALQGQDMIKTESDAGKKIAEQPADPGTGAENSQPAVEIEKGKEASTGDEEKDVLMTDIAPEVKTNSTSDSDKTTTTHGKEEEDAEMLDVGEQDSANAAGHNDNRIKDSQSSEATTTSSTTVHILKNSSGNPYQEHVSEDIFLTSAIDGMIRIWDRRVPQPVARIAPGPGVPPWCMSACWSPSGDWIYAGRRNGTVEEFSIHKATSGHWAPERTFRFPTETGSVTAVKSMPNGRHLLCASNDTLRLYDLQHDSLTTSTTTTATSSSSTRRPNRLHKTPFLVVPGPVRSGMTSNLYLDPTSRFLIATAGTRGWHWSSNEMFVGYEVYPM